MTIEMHGRGWLTLACLFLASLTVKAAQPGRLSDVRGVFQAHFNQDASRVLARTLTGQFGIWETKKGIPIAVDAALKKPVEGYVMSADGRRVLVGFKDGHARIFDTSTGAALSPVLDLALRESDNPQAIFSPDGSTLIFFGEKETSVLDVKTGKKVASMAFPFEVTEGSGSTASAIFTKDGAKCFISDSGATVTCYETKKWTALGNPMSHPAAEKAYTYGFDASSDGKWVVTFDDPGENGPKGNLQVWDASTSKPLGPPLVGENGMSGRFLPDQNRVLVGPGRGEATVRDLPSMAVSYEIKKHDELDGPKVEVFQNGKWVLAWGPDKKFDLIDAATGKIVSSCSVPAQVMRVNLAPDSSAFYLGWDADNPPSGADQHSSALNRFSTPDLKAAGSINIPDYLSGQSLSPDGRCILILQGADDEERIAIFETATMKPLEKDK
ncbi:MAG TPA: WD40 repeat domain-containing protein [Chthoniobacterales bacterium]|nr:WD40 repeat domain-containing protein [Chthoniobacterales bacterium]